jgi:hypothetical protein
VSSSRHHGSAFYIPICCACAGKKANVTRENKEEKEEKSHQKRFRSRAAREWEKVFSSRRSKADLRREKHLVPKDIIILPQNLSQLSCANEQSRGNKRGKGAHIDTVPKNDDSDDFVIGE